MEPKQTNETEFNSQDKINVYLTDEQFEELKREQEEYLKEEKKRNKHDRWVLIAFVALASAIVIFCAVYQVLLPIWR